MRKYRIALAAAAALFALPAAAQSIQFGPGGVRVDPGGPRGGGGRCAELRRACQMKDQLGERGEGNCRRFRAECGGGGRAAGPSRREVCAELRSACLNKDALGERGEGNCRRYRTTCRGML